MMPYIPTISYQNVIQNEVFFVKMGTPILSFQKKDVPLQHETYSHNYR